MPEQKRADDFDSILEAIKAAGIFQIYPATGGAFDVCQVGVCPACCRLSRDRLLELADELRALAETCS